MGADVFLSYAWFNYIILIVIAVLAGLANRKANDGYLPFQEALKADEKGTAEFLKTLVEDTMLKSLPLKDDIANVAVFAASPLAGKITGVTIDVTCGTTAGLNAKSIVIPFVS